MKNVFILLMLFLLSMISVSAISVTDNVIFNYSNDGGTSGDGGMKFITNQELNLTAIYKYPLSDCSQSYLWDSAHNVLASEGFNGNVAVYNYPLEENTEYYAICNNNGSAYTLYDSYAQNGAITPPIVGTNINFTCSWLGSNVCTYAVNIWNITTLNVSEEIIEEPNVTLCSTPVNTTYILYNDALQIVDLCINTSWSNSGMDFSFYDENFTNIHTGICSDSPLGVPSNSDSVNVLEMFMINLTAGTFTPNYLCPLNLSDRLTTIYWNIGVEYPNSSLYTGDYHRITFDFRPSTPIAPETQNPIDTSVLIIILGILMVIALVIGLFIAFTGDNEATQWMQKYFILGVILVIVILLVVLLSAL